MISSSCSNHVQFQIYHQNLKYVIRISYLIGLPSEFTHSLDKSVNWSSRKISPEFFRKTEKTDKRNKITFIFSNDRLCAFSDLSLRHHHQCRRAPFFIVCDLSKPPNPSVKLDWPPKRRRLRPWKGCCFFGLFWPYFSSMWLLLHCTHKFQLSSLLRMVYGHFHV